MIWEIIPQAPNYELSETGVLRNRITGKILKWTKGTHKTKTVQLYLGNKKRICATLQHLLWQLHGRCTSKVAPIAVSIKKGTRSLRFDSMKACALYLVKVTKYSYGGAYDHLCRRHTKIAEWEIRYIDPKENTHLKELALFNRT